MVVDAFSQGARSATLGYCLQPLRGKDRERDDATSPRVRCATLGYCLQPLRGKDRERADVVDPLYPGCAARPWAIACNRFAVRTTSGMILR